MQQDNRIKSHVTFVLTLLTALAAVLIAGFAWLASTKVDDIAMERQKDFVKQGLDEQVRAVARELESVTTWDDAVLFAPTGPREWVSYNLGIWMHQYFGHDRTYVFNPQDELAYVVRDGRDIPVPTFLNDAESVTALRDAIRLVLRKRASQEDVAQPEIAEIFETKIVNIDGHPAVVSARPIVPSSEKVSLAPGQEYVTVAVKFLDSAVVGEIGRYARLDKLHYASAAPPSLAAVPIVSTAGQPLGYLVWEPIRPGLMLIEQIAPAGLAGAVVAMGVVIFLGRGLHKTSVDLSESRLALMRHRDELEETVKLRTMEIERQREELDRLLAQERHVNALQRQFVAMASHEFRTPLAVIDAAAQRLSRAKASSKPDYVAEKAAQIRSAVLRMVDLMESILSAGRLETGKAEIKLERFSLTDLIESCCERQAEIRKSHVFHRDLVKLPETVLADRAAIEQVITNLLSNATKYAPQAPDIHITAWLQDRMAVVSIADGGIGMDAEDLPKLFQPYYRARSASGIAGTGIGLNIVKQIIDLHGGSVSVESSLGKGTTFTVALPTDGPLANLVKQAA